MAYLIVLTNWENTHLLYADKNLKSLETTVKDHCRPTHCTFLDQFKELGRVANFNQSIKITLRYIIWPSVKLLCWTEIKPRIFRNAYALGLSFNHYGIVSNAPTTTSLSQDLHSCQLSQHPCSHPLIFLNCHISNLKIFLFFHRWLPTPVS